MLYQRGLLCDLALVDYAAAMAVLFRLGWKRNWP